MMVPMFHEINNMTLKYKCLSTCPYYLTILCCYFLLLSCASQKDYYDLPAITPNASVNAIIEIKAGTNKKYEYDPLKKEIVIDKENGKERVIDFLPYPGNYGFIPSTLSKTDSGGDGDALDVLVISESIATGTVIETLPIALLKLIDDGEIDYKVIAVPVDKKKQIINATSYENLVTNYPKLLEIVELWFLNYNKNDISTIEGWGDEKEAFEEILRHLKHENP